MTCHGIIQPDLRHRVLNLMDRACLRRADALVAVSAPGAEQLSHITTRPQIHLVRNGVQQVYATVLPRIGAGRDGDVNLHGTIAVAEAASACDAGFVFAASCTVFGNSLYLPIVEDSPLAPTTPYALSKAAALGYVEWFTRNRGLRATSLILGNVYGPGSRRGVVGMFVGSAISGQPATLHGQGRTTRDFVHIDDVANAVLLACANPVPVG